MSSKKTAKERHAGLHVAVILPMDVAPRMDGPDKVHLVGVGHPHQLGDLPRLGLGVRVAPTVAEAVEGVVLRAVDIGVHLGLAIEGELALARLKAPRQPVKPLDRPAEGHVRPILEGDARVAVGRQKLAQGLDAIEEARGVGRRQIGARLAEHEGVALLRQPLLQLPRKGERRLLGHLEGLGERRARVRVESLRRREGDLRRRGEIPAREGDLLRRRINPHGRRQRVRAER